MGKVNIREANTHDMDILLQFEQGVIQAERPFDKTLGADPITYYDLKALMSDDKAIVVVAEYDDVIVGSGYAMTKLARHYLDHTHYAYLGFMYTSPKHRGRGINRKIIDYLKKWANEKGLKEIRLTVYEENENAIRAYEKAGFKKHIIEMRID